MALPHFLPAQSRREITLYYDERGSVPPVPQWFSCVWALDGKPYDGVKSQGCLDSILAHPEFESGKLSLKHYKKADVLTFHLRSPSLIVSGVDLGISAREIAQVQEFLAINGNALRQGETYEHVREAMTRMVLDLHLRSQGRQAGISRTVHLDYAKKTAQVAFRIWEGPQGIAQPLVPPYAEQCKILNGFFNWTDADDLSPVSFVEREMRTKWCGCFSEADVQNDLAALKEMKFLKEANISVEGSGNVRSVSVHLRGQAIPIADVRVRGYGLLEGLKESEIPPLTIHTGDSYSNSAIRNLERILEKSFAKDGRQVQVFSDVQVSAKGEASLNFGVLAYPDDFVYVNGSPFDSTDHEPVTLVSSIHQ
jgi:hypothetical protein